MKKIILIESINGKPDILILRVNKKYSKGLISIFRETLLGPSQCGLYPGKICTFFQDDFYSD